MKTLSLIAIMGSILLGGCVGPQRIKPGSDPIVVNAEQFAKEATDTIDDFIKFVDRNWAAAGSDMRAARDIAAADGPVYLRALRNATKAYKANRLPENEATLQEKIAGLQSLLDVIREYVNPKPTNA
jgi:hypothetical protein